MPNDTRSVCFIRDNYRWELRPEDVPVLARLLDLPGEPVTATGTKLIVRWRLDGRVYYWKRYVHESRTWRPLKYWFKKPRSRHEWDRAELLGKTGVPIVPHFAHGERRTWRGLAESSLITLAPPGVQPLSATQLRSAAIQSQFGSFVRVLHERGVIHLDPNPGNFLCSEALNSFFLVDLDKIRIREKPLSARDRLDNLALLWATFPALNEVFFKALDDPKLNLGLLKAKSDQRRRELLCEEVARSLPPRQHDDFCRAVRSDIGWIVRKAAVNPSVEAISQDPDHCLEEASVLFKDSRSSTVASVAGYVVKRYNLRRPWKWAKANLRGSYAKRAFRLAYHLELAGIPGARPEAFGDRRCFGVLVRSYLITQAIPGARPLDQLRECPTEALLGVARLLARLHLEGFRQLDPKPSNILIGPGNTAHLVDTDGIRFVGRVTQKAASRDIARLLMRLRLAPAARALFLQAYQEARAVPLGA